MVSGLVLASGYGSRLRKYSFKPKYFVDVFGRPLISYPLYSLREAGIDRLYIIVNEEINGYLDNHRELVDKFGLSVILNPYPELENGYTLLYGLNKIMDDWIVVSVSDHIYPPEVVKRMIDFTGSDGDFYIAGDSNPKYVDVSEATKILTDKSGKIIMVGKELNRYNYIDMGVFLFTKNIFQYIDFESKPKITISELINRIVRSGSRGYVVVFKDVEWKDVDTIDDLKFVKSGLFRNVISKYFDVAMEGEGLHE